MKSNSLVSAIIIFLNGESFLEEAIASIFAQTYKNWELLLVDDGSTDDSTMIAQKYVQKYPERVHYLEYKENQKSKISGPRNLGIQHAKGEYIGFLEANDIWLPQKLEQQVEVLKNHSEAKMVYGRVQYWYSWAGYLEKMNLDHCCDLGVYPNQIIAPPTLFLLMLQNQCQTAKISDALIRREAFCLFGEFEELNRRYSTQTFFAKAQLQASIFVSGECWVKCRENLGDYNAATNTTKTNSEHLQFLDWVRRYIHEENYQDPQTQQILESEVENHSTEKIAEIILSSFPNFTIRSIQYLDQGVSSRAYRVNGEYIFKFPKSEEAEISLIKEVNTLQFLRNESVAKKIPCPDFIKDDDRLNLNYCPQEIETKSLFKQLFGGRSLEYKSKNKSFFMGYKEIEGDFLFPDFIENYSHKAQCAIAEEIASFLSDLHSISLPSKLSRSVQIKALRYYTRYYVIFLCKVSRLIEREYREKLISSFHHNFRNLLLFRTDYTFIHGDFRWDHIIVNEHNKQISGFIDFGEFRVDDPAHDFAEIQSRYGNKFLDLILKYYKTENCFTANGVEKLKQRIWLICCCHCIDRINSELKAKKKDGVKEKAELLKLLAQI